jgi:hypothetical protein
MGNLVESVSALFLAASLAVNVFAQSTEREIAAQFAPVFYQGLGENPRSDYITNFDFDGDWRGDNNWNNAGNLKFPLRAYIYFSVSETQTHYFVHYAVFHPRDYKGGEVRGRILSDLLGTGAKIVGERDPTGLLAEATSAHENDMEGALVVAAKNGTSLATAHVEYVETLSHNRFIPYAVNAEMKNVGRVRSEGQNVMLLIEPRGHGIRAYEADDGEKKGKDFIVYKYTGTAEDPEARIAGPIGYDLVPIQTTLWPRARQHASKKGLRYGRTHNYGSIKLNLVSKGGTAPRTVKIGSLGSSFLGTVGGRNMARPPWGWFDMNRRTDPLGLWFFDPAAVVKRDLNLAEGFSTIYVRLPFWATVK